MPLDEQVRQSAEALASDIGRALQEKLGQFVDTVLAEAAVERDALTAQAAQFAADADARLETAVAQAVADATAAHESTVARLREATESEQAEALARVRATFTDESASVLVQAREEAAASLAEALARAREESEAETTAAHARARDEAAAELAEAVKRAREEAASEATAMVARAREEVANASAQLQADQDARQAEVDRASLERQRDEREAMLAEMERLVESVRRLDATASLSALLDALADAAAQEAPRTALLLLRGRDLQGWAFSGFDEPPAEPRRLIVPLDGLGDFARVLATRTRAEVHPSTFTTQAAAPLAFAAPRAGDVGVAVPVTVGGDVAALLYADDGGGADRTVPASWPETLELLARHAARCLEAQTAIRASRLAVSPAQTPPQAGAASSGVGRGTADTQDEDAARRYARLVVSDIRLSHEPVVRLGREQRDIADRLKPQIERARELYLQRIPASVRTRDRLFDEELVRTLADGDASLLGSLPAATVS
jgi:chemotaxis protein histidine kinase CheA